MEFGLVHGFFCFSLLILGIVGLIISFPAIAKKDIIKWLVSSFQQPATELTEQEIKDNNLLIFDVSKEIKLRKTLPNGAILEEKITHGGFGRNEFVVFDEGKKVFNGNPSNYIIRGENLYRVLAGDTNIIVEYEDSDKISYLQNMISLKNIEIANLTKKLRDYIESTKKQIIEEHELRKEETKARFGGTDPSRRFLPERWKGFGGYGTPFEGEAEEI